MKNKNYKQLLALATCIIALVVVAVVRDGKVWGHKMSMANIILIGLLLMIFQIPGIIDNHYDQ